MTDLDAKDARIAELEEQLRTQAGENYKASSDAAEFHRDHAMQLLSAETAKLKDAHALLGECERVLRTALDCASAAVGARLDDPEAAEAFDMWNEARTAGRKLLTKLKDLSQNASRID